MSDLVPGLRAFVAAVHKEWRVRARQPAFYGGIVVWPLLLPLIYVMQARAFAGGDPRAVAAFVARTGTSEVAGFLYVGGAVFFWLSAMLGGAGTSLRLERVRGSLEHLFVTPAPRAVIIFGPMPVYVLQGLWTFAIVLVALRLAYRVPLTWPASLHALAIVVLSVPVFTGLGATFGALVIRFRQVAGAIQVTRGVVQLFCGMTFPIVVLPGWARAVALVLPPTYAIADVRAALLDPAGLAGRTPDLLVLAGFGVGLCLLPVLLFARFERRVLGDGSLAAQ